MIWTMQLLDGSFEILDDPIKQLKPLIEKYMGENAAFIFEECIRITKEEALVGDNYELISDGLRRLAIDTMNELEEALSKPKLERKTVERITQNLGRNL